MAGGHWNAAAKRGRRLGSSFASSLDVCPSGVWLQVAAAALKRKTSSVSSPGDWGCLAEWLGERIHQFQTCGSDQVALDDDHIRAQFYIPTRLDANSPVDV